MNKVPARWKICSPLENVCARGCGYHMVSMRWMTWGWSPSLTPETSRLPPTTGMKENTWTWKWLNPSPGEEGARSPRPGKDGWDLYTQKHRPAIDRSGRGTWGEKSFRDMREWGLFGGCCWQKSRITGEAFPWDPGAPQIFHSVTTEMND